MNKQNIDKRLIFANANTAAIPIHLLTPDSLSKQSLYVSKGNRQWINANSFNGELGQVVLCADTNGNIDCVYAGWGNEETRARTRYPMAKIAAQLPKNIYEIVSGLDNSQQSMAALSWLFSSYYFDRYKKKSKYKAILKPHQSIDKDRLLALAQADFLARDLINTPASDMGPSALEAAFRDLAYRHNAQVKIIKGDDLLKHNLTLIHAVGRAAAQVPRLLDMRWGDENHPKITLVGKGVCFDTGGLNLKPGNSMGLMKKDMSGAAIVMALALMIMSLNVPIRLRVLVPAVENAVSANAFRPQDILHSRKGLTIEVNNTDAEGRLILADALCLADEEAPDLLICKATLTGAARVAVGADIVPFFTDNDALAEILYRTGCTMQDPLWRLPFWQPYENKIESYIADLNNAPAGGMAGAITAALFLRRFVTTATDFVYLDLYGWIPMAKPGRTKGGICQSARALLAVIEQRYAKYKG